MTFVSISPPGSTEPYTDGTHVSSVDGNNIVGSYQDGNYTEHGFLYDGTTYKTLDAPGSIDTFSNGISGKNVVGTYLDAHGVTHGYLYNGSTYTTINPPQGGQLDSIAGVSGANVVGTYEYTKGAILYEYGFLHNGASYVVLKPPGALTAGLSVAGVSGDLVAGTFSGDGGVAHGFSYFKGTYTVIDPPGSGQTTVTGVSGKTVAGYYSDTINPSNVHGFLFDGVNYTTFDVPQSAETLPSVISGSYLAGTFSTSSSNGIFFYNGGSYTKITPPGAAVNQITAVSGNKVFGSFTDSFGGTPYNGFVATVGQTATVSLGNLSAIYNGAQQAVTTTTNPPGLSTTITYSSATYPPSTTPPSAEGRYDVTAAISTPGYSGTAQGTLAIGKATATVTLGNLSTTYTGSAQAATAATNPSGLDVTFTYDGKTAAPVNVGSYKVIGTVVDPNYRGSATGTMVITKATATVTITPSSLSATYNGKAIAASATTSPPNQPVTFTYTQNGKQASPINAGTYDVTATVNNANASGSTTGTLTIDPMPLTVYFNNLPSTFTGKPIVVTGSTLPVNVPVTITYSGTASPSTPPTAVGDYLVTASLANANYVISNTATATLHIANPIFFAPTPATPLLSASGAQVGLSVRTGGLATTVYFQYSTDPNFATYTLTPEVHLGAGMQQVLFSSFLGDLDASTTYYYRVWAESAAGDSISATHQVTSLAFNLSEVASTGTLAPGTALRWGTLGSGALNAQDGAAFKATLAGAPTAMNTGIWANVANSGTLSLVAQTGSTGNFRTLSDPIYNGNGCVVFLGDTGLGPAIWSAVNGTVRQVSSPGDPISGSPAVFASFLGVALDDANVISNQVYAFAKLKDDPHTGTTTANDSGIFVGLAAAPLTFTPIARTGDSVRPNFKTLTKIGFLAPPPYVVGQTRNVSTNGNLVFNATFSDKSTGIVLSAGGPATVVAQTGDSAIGMSGATFSAFGNPAVNYSGHTAFAATVTGSGITKLNNSGIWGDDSTGTRQIRARLGDIAPGTATSARFTALSDPVFNINDAVAFRATLSTGTGAATATTNTGLWCDSTGTLALVAQAGEQAPGCPIGVKFATFTELALDDINGATQQGGVIFLATLTGTGVATTNNTAILAQDATGTVQLIVRTGDILNGKTITALTFLPTESGANAPVAGQTRSFSPTTGDLLYTATFSDKSQAIFNVVYP